MRTLVILESGSPTMLITGSKSGLQRPEDAHDEKRAALIPAALLAAAVLVLWALPIRSSFWLDETGTFWVIKDGLSNVLARSFSFSGQSPLYYLTAWAALVAGGREEWVLRMPSLAAMLVAAWLFYRLAQRLFDTPAARMAVIFFACCEPIAFAASDARPYALGLATLIGSALMLVRWLDTGRTRDAAGYTVFSVLAIYSHYFFGTAVAVLALYAAARLCLEGRSGLWKLLASWAAAGILLLPLAPQLLQFYQTRGAHSFGGSASVGDLFGVLAPPVLAGSLAAGVFLTLLMAPQTPHPSAPRGSLLLAAGWALAPPLALFAISVLSPAKMFISRYYIGYLPGLCLIAGWMARALLDRRGQHLVGALLVVSSILSFGSRHHGGEDWSGAMRKVRSLDHDGSLPVLAASGFVEATDPSALANPRLQEVLFAPLAMYPPGGRLLRLPYVLNEESATYVESILPAVENESRFVLIVRYQGFTFEPWLRGRMAARGFRSESLGNVRGVGVFLFSRPDFRPAG